ncbi:hypothetical protein [Leyella lascolaii]|uniref:Uncharacterized protein n=1 Tax=Leyella lascolaii TaxID=1776379 RepID=A0AAW7JJE3_9BACT|nr:hypothetical protein [Leyella lascolaii]MDN0023341.1 hypothetical protein [Leyella lascolaii]MDN0025983.1 hypothetical protein [Leyella lascolaii]
MIEIISRLSLSALNEGDTSYREYTLKQTSDNLNTHHYSYYRC